MSSGQSSRPEKDEHVHATFEEAGGKTNGDDSRIYIMSAFPEFEYVLKMQHTKKDSTEVNGFAGLAFGSGIIPIVLILDMST